MYYHGSRNGEIKELTLEKSHDGYVWLAEDYCFAVLYAGNSVRFWGINRNNGKLRIRELCENGLEKMYKGVKCYIYCVEDENVGEFERYDYKGRKSIRVQHDVKIDKRIVIDDAYDEIMRLYNEGRLELLLWNERDEKEREEDRQRTLAQLCKDMKENHEKYPEDYATLIKIFPETELKEI